MLAEPPILPKSVVKEKELKSERTLMLPLLPGPPYVMLYCAAAKAETEKKSHRKNTDICFIVRHSCDVRY